MVGAVFYRVDTFFLERVRKALFTQDFTLKS